ncbi:Uncharacterised protein [Bordetella pertussis]|nr:Uncharacterised protein [Bordetella pertussis]
MTAVRASGRATITMSSGIAVVSATPSTCHPARYSWRGSLTVTSKSSAIAISHR